jgi:hypothetical protein
MAGHFVWDQTPAPRTNMSLETRITEAATEAVFRLHDDLRARLTALSDELRAAAAAAGHEAEIAHAEATTVLQDEIARLCAEVADRDRQLADLDQQANTARDTHAVTLARFRQHADATLADAEKALVEAVRQAQLHEAQSKAADRLEPPQVASHDGAARVQALALAVTGMDDATTLSEVLDALSDGLKAQAPRSAVLVFQDDRARIWRRSGFPQETPGIGAELHLPDHADLMAILDSAAPAIVEGSDEQGAVLGLAPLPVGQQGLAVPVAIGGQAAALVYADGASTGEPALAPGWTDAVEVLARHAARCLETLTAMRAAGYARTQRPAVVVPMPPHLRIVQRPTLETSMGDAIEQARRVARLLVSEIRLNREADVMEGRAQGDLGTRLGEDIERARRQYVQRVPEALPGRETLFDEEVVRTLANGDATLLRTGS